MVPELVIVGGGQLGSRYLQGLGGVAMQTAITVVDPSADSLARAEKRWAEVDGPKSLHSVRWCTDIRDVGADIDLAIVATAADIRANVVSALAAGRTVRYWVLEKVLAQAAAQLDRLKLATRDAEGVWVNTPRRMIHWHRALARAFFWLPRSSVVAIPDAPARGARPPAARRLSALYGR